MGGALIETSARAILKETALRMLKRGKMTVGEIAEDTGLSLAEVQRLRKTLDEVTQQVRNSQ